MGFMIYRRPCTVHPKSNVKLPSGVYQCLRCVFPPTQEAATTAPPEAPLEPHPAEQAGPDPFWQPLTGARRRNRPLTEAELQEAEATRYEPDGR